MQSYCPTWHNDSVHGDLVGKPIGVAMTALRIVEGARGFSVEPRRARHSFRLEYSITQGTVIRQCHAGR
jgi:hypothetical protein